MKAQYGVIVYVSWESCVDAGVPEHIENLVEEFNAAVCAFVLTRLGCPQQAIALCDHVHDLWDTGGIGFRFIADHTEQGLPACAPGRQLFRVSMEDFTRQFKKGLGGAWLWPIEAWR